jgi:hypothetical protein
MFAPPIESAMDRLVNMANACETFQISAHTVANLIQSGFRSLTQLSLMRPAILAETGPFMDQNRYVSSGASRTQTEVPQHDVDRVA